MIAGNCGCGDGGELQFLNYVPFLCFAEAEVKSISNELNYLYASTHDTFDQEVYIPACCADFLNSTVQLRVEAHYIYGSVYSDLYL